MAAQGSKYKIAPIRSKRPATGKKDPNQALKDSLKAHEEDVKRLSQENELFKDTISGLMSENKVLKDKYIRVVKCTLEHIDKKAFPIVNFAASHGDIVSTEEDEAMNVDVEFILKSVAKIAQETLRKRSAIESRVEELETRVTEQSLELSRLLARGGYCSSVVDEALDSDSLDDIREQLSGLQQDLLTENPLLDDADNVPLFKLEPVNDDHKRRASLMRSLDTQSPFTLGKPTMKAPGDVHIKAMNSDLRNYVMHELSMERASCADWRTLAERVGISAATVDCWRRLRLPCPTSQVLAFWGDSAGATVRMLHRHLVSPQLRALIVAKRIADHYDVI